MTMGKFRLLCRIAALVLLLGACTTPQQTPLQASRAATARATTVAAPTPPVAARKPYLVTSPNGAREDEYYWLRDDTRQSQEVLDYLNAAPRFLPLHSSEGITLVHRRFIVSVRSDE